MRRSHIIGATLVAVAFVGWALFRPERLVVDQEVSEAFPMSDSAAPAMTPASDSMMTMEDSAMPVAVMDSMPMTDDGQAPATLARGQFHSNAHETTGKATVYRLGDGRRVLRLTEFTTSNGPDVRVYLVAASDVQDPETVKSAGFVDLGGMKGNIGDQNYDVPADLDLSKYRAVSIWCRRFSVNFGAAPLTAAP